MAHFAKLDENNIVIEVIKVGNGDVDANGGDFSEQAEQWVSATFKGTFKQTSYNSCGEYRPAEDVFVGAKNHSSWVLDTTQWVYKAPVEYPTVLTYGDNSPYFMVWDEDNLRWLSYDSSNNEFAWDPSSESWSATGN